MHSERRDTAAFPRDLIERIDEDCAGWTSFSQAGRRLIREAHPFRMVPTFHPRIWGERSLAPIFPEKVNLSENIGEAWLTDARCLIAGGPFATKTLQEAWSEIPAEWRGPRCAEMQNFPLLLKFVFPADKLSIQVHPDDEYASAHEASSGGRGKTEMWHVVSAKPGAELLLGLKSGVTKKAFSAAIGSKAIENLFQVHQVEEKQTYFIPARTPHSIGGGMVVFEVQQYCDLRIVFMITAVWTRKACRANCISIKRWK
jgi:mannose-6-phosphate isomerase